MRNLMNSTAGMRPVTVKKENDDDENVLCGEVKVEYMMDAEQIDTSTDSDETSPSNMQQNVSSVADDWVTKIDYQYKKLLDSFREDGTSDLSDNPLRSIRYEVDNGTYDKREFKAPVTSKRSREDRKTIRVAKKNVEPKPRVQSHTKKTTTKEAGFGLRRRQSLGSEKSVEAKHITSHVKRNSQHNGDASEKEDLEDHMVLDESYKSYLTWLVEKSSGTTLEKEIRVKCEEDYTMSLSDSDSDVVVIGDRPFLDEEDSPFVPSKSYKVIDLDDESGDQGSSWFRKEIMNVLKEPYTETELKELHKKASVHGVSTRHMELRDGRDFSFNTKQVRPSYLDRYPDFKKKYITSLEENDEHKALNLLRGFIFYLKNVVRDGAFKPWLDHECLKIRCPDKTKEYQHVEF